VLVRSEQLSANMRRGNELPGRAMPNWLTQCQASTFPHRPRSKRLASQIGLRYISRMANCCTSIHGLYKTGRDVRGRIPVQVCLSHLRPDQHAARVGRTTLRKKPCEPLDQLSIIIDYQGCILVGKATRRLAGTLACALATQSKLHMLVPHPRVPHAGHARRPRKIINPIFGGQAGRRCGEESTAVGQHI
jgi:hypothetical protein